MAVPAGRPCPVGGALLTPGLRAESTFQGPDIPQANSFSESTQFLQLRPVIVPVALLPPEKHALQFSGFLLEASLLSIGKNPSILGPRP